MRPDFEQHLQACCVQITVGEERGTGFFVAPDVVLTCAHVLEKRSERAPVQVTWQGRQLPVARVIATERKYPDLARIELEAPPGGAMAPHPCVRLDADVCIEDQAYAYGFSDLRPGGDPALVVLEGSTGGPERRLKLKEGQIRPGMSGGPLLNLRTAMVCGIVQKTRDSASDLGGLALATPEILAFLGGLQAAQAAWHAADGRWDALARAHRGDAPTAQPLFNPGVERFLTEYLGTEKKPVPFGGRAAELDALDAWLDDAPERCLLLTAPAGRGKSALLVRWVQRLKARPGMSVVFFPVSIRFRTNLARVALPSLIAGVAAAQGAAAPVQFDASIESWKATLASLLGRPLPEGRRLVLVLDGIDEAADWEADQDLFPFELPPRVRVVASARAGDGDADAGRWLRALGWEEHGLARTMALHVLTPEGVADVLIRMGVPLDRLGKRVDIVAEIHRLTEGDPLLVGLYVGDLWAQGDQATRLKPADLAAIRPGLEGYFQRWWEDQRRLWRGEVPWRGLGLQLLVNLLACALGPLGQDDLLRLLPPEAQIRTSLALEEAVAPLSRFLVGDGRQAGYAFSHPRLAAYFYARMGFEERCRWEGLFLAWGREVVARLKEGPPTERDRYPVQFYGAHLARAMAPPEELFALVSEQWMRAWVRLSGGYAGFLADVARAHERAGRENEEALTRGRPAPHLALELRCTLAQTSINALVRDIPLGLVVMLVQDGLWTIADGIEHARRLPSLGQQARALAALLDALPDARRHEVLGEAVRVAAAAADADADDSVEVMVGLRRHLPRALWNDPTPSSRPLHPRDDPPAEPEALMPAGDEMDPARVEERPEVERHEDILAEIYSSWRVIVQAADALSLHIPPHQRAERALYHVVLAIAIWGAAVQADGAPLPSPPRPLPEAFVMIGRRIHAPGARHFVTFLRLLLICGGDSTLLERAVTLGKNGSQGPGGMLKLLLKAATRLQRVDQNSVAWRRLTEALSLDWPWADHTEALLILALLLLPSARRDVLLAAVHALEQRLAAVDADVSVFLRMLSEGLSVQRWNPVGSLGDRALALASKEFMVGEAPVGDPRTIAERSLKAFLEGEEPGERKKEDEGPGDRNEELTRVLARLPEGDSAEVVDHVLSAARSIQDRRTRLALMATAIAADPRIAEPIAPRLGVELIFMAWLQVLPRLPGRVTRRILRALPSLADFLELAAPLLVEDLTADEAVEADDALAMLLVLLGEKFTPTLQAIPSERLAAARKRLFDSVLMEMKLEGENEEFLEILLQSAPSDFCIAVLDRAQLVDYAALRGRILARLAARLPPDALRSALASERARADGIEPAWHDILGVVLDGPGSGRIRAALDRLYALAAHDSSVACALIAAAAPEDVLRHARTLPTGEHRMRALAALLPHLVDPERSAALDEFLATVDLTRSDDGEFPVNIRWMRAAVLDPEAWLTLVPVLLIDMSSNDAHLGEALTVAAEHLPRSRARHVLLKKLLGLARSIEDPDEQCAIIAAIMGKATNAGLWACLDQMTDGLLSHLDQIIPEQTARWREDRAFLAEEPTAAPEHHLERMVAALAEKPAAAPAYHLERIVAALPDALVGVALEAVPMRAAPKDQKQLFELLVERGKNAAARELAPGEEVPEEIAPRFQLTAASVDRIVAAARSIRDHETRFAFVTAIITNDPRPDALVAPRVALELMLTALMLDRLEFPNLLVRRILPTLPTLLDALEPAWLTALIDDLASNEDIQEERLWTVLAALPPTLLAATLEALSSPRVASRSRLAEPNASVDLTTMEGVVQLSLIPWSTWRTELPSILEADNDRLRGQLLVYLAATFPLEEIGPVLATERARCSGIDTPWHTVLSAIVEGLAEDKFDAVWSRLDDLTPKERDLACMLLAPTAPDAVLRRVWTPARLGRDAEITTDLAFHTLRLVTRDPEAFIAFGVLLLVYESSNSAPDRGETLAMAAEYLPRARAPHVVLAGLLNEANAIADPDAQASAIKAITCNATEACLSDYLDIKTGGLMQSFSNAIPEQVDRWRTARAWLLEQVNLSDEQRAIRIAEAIPDAFIGGVLSALPETLSVQLRRRLIELLAPRAPESAGQALVRAIEIGNDAEKRLEWFGALVARLRATIRPVVEAAMVEAVCELARACTTSMAAHQLGDEIQCLRDVLSPKSMSYLAHAVHTACPVRLWPSLLTRACPAFRADLQVELVRQGADACQAIFDREERLAVLLELARAVPRQTRRPILEEALRETQSINDDREQAEALVALAPWADEATQTEALQVARRVDRLDRRAQLLAMLTPNLPEHARADAARDAFAATQIGAWLAQADSFRLFAEWLPDGLLADLCAAVADIPYERDRARALLAIAPRLSGDLLDQAFAVAREMRSEFHRASAIVGLTAYLPPESRREVLSASEGYQDAAARARLAVGLLPYASREERPRAIEHTVDCIGRSDAYPGRRADLLALAALVPPARMPAFLEASRRSGTPDDRVAILAEIARREDVPDRAALLDEALQALRAIHEIEQRARAVAALAPLLPPERSREEIQAALGSARLSWSIRKRTAAAATLGYLLEPADLEVELDAIRDCADIGTRLYALELIGPVLPEPILRAAVRWIRSSGSDTRGEELMALARNVSPSLAPEVLDAARLVRDGALQSRLVSMMAQAPLPPLDSYRRFSRALKVLATGTRAGLLASLGTLAPAIIELGGAAAARETTRSIVEISGWW